MQKKNHATSHIKIFLKSIFINRFENFFENTLECHEKVRNTIKKITKPLISQTGRKKKKKQSENPPWMVTSTLREKYSDNIWSTNKPDLIIFLKNLKPLVDWIIIASFGCNNPNKGKVPITFRGEGGQGCLNSMVSGRKTQIFPPKLFVMIIWSRQEWRDICR